MKDEKRKKFSYISKILRCILNYNFIKVKNTKFSERNPKSVDFYILFDPDRCSMMEPVVSTKGIGCWA